jgi:twitching motility protein PilT
MVNPAAAALIREGKLHQLENAMKTGQARGSVVLDDHLAYLLKRGRITAEEARRQALDPSRFEGGS